jgi:dTDP-4-amino-4,6-dideoxygalactose transaminase
MGPEELLVAGGQERLMVEYEKLSEVNRPFFEEYKAQFHNVLESGWFILGNQVEEFERNFAAYIGSRFCTGVASGLDALILALKSLHLKDGSEVLVPSNTYIATILAILQAGLRPVLVEPDIISYNIDPSKIEEKINSKTKALMVVHLYGKVCDMDPIMELCGRYKLKLIEDCAQAHGAKYKGRLAGTFGEFGAFSFYPTKNLGALGDGGALTTNDEALDQEVRILRNYGSRIKYFNEQVGFNSRLDEIQAAFLNVKLKSLNKINTHKRRLAELYFQGIKDDFIKPAVHKNYYDIYHVFNIRHKNRDALKKYLLSKNIKTDIHYPVSPNKQEAMKGIIDHVFCPISEEIHSTTLSLPISYGHAEDDILKVIEAVNSFDAGTGG